MLAKYYQELSTQCDNPQEWKAKFTLALRKFVNAHFYSVDEILCEK